jgi:acyl-CoA synthetase (AMP-forming)/AMP-acid ligase II/acyl carrier protein
MAASALLVSERDQTEAPAAAAQLGIPVMRVACSDDEPAGIFALKHVPAADISDTSCASGESADDVCLVLHTSGTTSQPKRVPLTHANVCASAENIRRTLELDSSDCCLNVMPLFHVHGLIGCILSSWASGATVVIPGRFYAPGFFDLLAEFTPTWFSATPAILQAVMDRAPQHSQIIARHSLRFVRSASSPLSQALLRQIEDTFRVPVVECYGMTEAAHQVASNGPSYAARKPGSVGQAAGPRVAVMDSRGNLLPAGLEGEIVIRGPNVTRGYENDPVANESAFSGGWFRTGDLGHLDDKAALFISGRIKEIINRGGEKISPREVEEVLNEHEAVSEVAVFGVPDDRLGEEVAAAVVLGRKAQASAAELQQFALARLADFKVPRHVSFMKELPRSSTGKVQRLELAAAFRRSAGLRGHPRKAGPVVPPGTETERNLSVIWHEVMKVGDISVDDNFFELGGDSIQAAMILSRIQAVFGRAIPLTAFFDDPTISSLATALAGPDGRRPAAARLPITRETARGPAPLASVQKFIYALEQHPLITGTGALNRCAALRLSGPLDRDSLRSGLHAVLLRHDILRSRIFRRDDAVLQEPRDMPNFELPELDLRPCAREERTARLEGLAAQQAGTPFRLSDELPVRFCLLCFGESDHVLLFVTHYIVFDAWSMRLFARELVDCYEAARHGGGAAVSLPPLQYRDYGAWQARLEREGHYSREIAYWKEKLNAMPHFRTDLRRQMRGAVSFCLSTHTLAFSRDLVRAARRLAQREKATLFMVLLAALKITIARLSGRDDVVVISQTSGRNRVETETIVGCFVNLLVLRTRLEPSLSFNEFLQTVRQTCLDAFDHQDLPITRLQAECLAERDLINDPVSPVIFNFKNFDLPSLRADELLFQPLELDYHAEPAGLILKIFDHGEGLDGALLYNAKLFSPGLVEQLARSYLMALEEAIDRPHLAVRDLLRWGTLLRRLGPNGIWQMLRGMLSFVHLARPHPRRRAD